MSRIPTKAGKAAPRQPVKAVAPVESSDESDSEVMDSEDYDDDDSEEEEEEETTEDEGEDDDDGEDDFEVQSSSGEEDDDDEDETADDVHNESSLRAKETAPRNFAVGQKRMQNMAKERESGALQRAQFMHADDLSSDDEDGVRRNTIGRVPLHWYDAFDHVGYDISGSKMAKRTGKDSIDVALQQRDNPAASRIIYDMYNDREVVLTDRQLELIRRVQAGAFAHPEFNDTPDYVDYVSGIKEIMPLSMAPERKAAFLPSKWEMGRIMQMAKAIQEGRYVFGGKLAAKKQAREAQHQQSEQGYIIWKDDEDDAELTTRQRFHLPAPKLPLPGHGESYNPPSEYLFNAEEEAKYNALDNEEKQQLFKPQQFSCLRHVPAYADFVRERYERCLDLYLCPRKMKQRLNIDPEALVPKLPHPRELKPYPNTLLLQFQGHQGSVTCMSLSPDGQYLVSGGVDGTVRLWETDTCLCRYVWTLSSGASVETVQSVAWNPDPQTAVVAAAVGTRLVLITTGTGDSESKETVESFLSTVLEAAVGGNGSSKSAGAAGQNGDADSSNDDDADSDDDSDDNDSDEEDEQGEKGEEKPRRRKFMTVQWRHCSASANASSSSSSSSASSSSNKVGPRVSFSLPTAIAQVTWHHKGDYLAVLCPQAPRMSHAISIHQISKNTAQWPFKQSPGQRIQRVIFHPTQPCLCVVTQQHVKLYHLVEQRLVKKLMSGCKWLSAVDIHPSGDHLIVGSFDRRVVWFDLDLGSNPYKTLKFHEKAVRDIAVHRRYPLFASASDDGSVHVFHGMVYHDFTRNPLLVPLKVLRGHGQRGDLGVLSLAFHPRQPWLFTAGADGLINLYHDL